MDSDSFAYRIRTQFSFLASNRTLHKILSGIACESINITGYLQTKRLETECKPCLDIDPDCNLVRLVVGIPDDETKKDLRGTREVLESLCVDFQEQPVIQVVEIMPGVPGVINAVFGALWRKVDVYAIYIGENTALFVDVSDIEKAVDILSQVSDG